MITGTPSEGSANSSSPHPGTGHEEARVLVIDDNETTARALASLLATAHYQAAVFYRGHEALDYARDHTCLAAVVDIHLPDMSGLVLAQQLRDRFGPDTPVVILSGDTSLSTLNALSEVGATHFFSKPVNASHLLEQLSHWIEEAGKKMGR